MRCHGGANIPAVSGIFLQEQFPALIIGAELALLGKGHTEFSVDDLGPVFRFGDYGLLDTARVKGFRVPAGVLVTLPQGTNTDQLVMKDKTAEDDLLTARNK